MGKIDREKGGRKKLSWIYRKKRKSENRKKSEDNRSSTATENKNARIIVRNLPFQATESEVRKFYEPFGEVKDVNLPKRADGKPIGCGFVQFTRVEDASKAIFNTNKKEFLGRVINSDWAIPKSKFCEKIDKLAAEAEQQGKNKDTVIGNGVNKQPSTVKAKSKDLKRENRKQQKLLRRKQRSKVIVRNLPFQITEDQIKDHFSKYGSIEEIKILTRPDGKYVGCAFIQFDHVQCAAKAIHYGNLEPLLDRPVVIDWAIPKDKFSEVKKEKEETGENSEIKEEPNEEEISEIKSEPNGSLADMNSEQEYEQTDDELHADEVKTESEADDKESENDSDIESGDASAQQEMDEDEEEQNSEPIKRVSNDVTEGRTVFLKNVPFSVKNEELKTYMEQFGPLYYALICIDPLTEHSKGTAFVKFKNVEDAEKCLSGETELRLRDQALEAHRALPRGEVEGKGDLKRKKERDSRNLYLVKEGVIPAGSPAAVDVSASDMAKRLQLEQWKSQMLRNLNMFVSKVRLVVHNLPPSFDNSKLRELFKNHSGKKAIITEARVMRDMKNIDATGLGKSKEHGFVSFTSHEDALKALRSINNNPNIFTKHKRPIVAFSIENRIMVNAKERRVQKSRERNPLWTEKANVKRDSTDKIERRNEAKRNKTERESKKESNAELPSFSGTASKPGNIKMRSRHNLKTQAIVHSKTIKKAKKKSKSLKRLQERRKEEAKSRAEVKVKQNTKKKSNVDEENFSKLVSSYKDKLTTMASRKSKWYENT